MRIVTAWMFVVLGAVGCGGDDDNIENQTESLQPTCITSDTCPYGHCTTEDGICDSPQRCQGSICIPCYGVCVADPAPN